MIKQRDASEAGKDEQEDRQTLVVDYLKGNLQARMMIQRLLSAVLARLNHATFCFHFPIINMHRPELERAVWLFERRIRNGFALFITSGR